ncbi:tetratricopeptide repeat protein [Xylanibacter ruminicola]|uniref:Anaphase-promoting complex, cyclosome, subunit 3 n=1 Tax=Xylanibacter ruminicola TaxID=839 RepID=A0A1M6Y992_XYLRU|nr:tetratricopeptide repeat protein [Xylanibacter ruminicola]SHL14743.1 Anaphase-promoting complex, cyclosome, subunit 3 [Xylanibacter ruminicola]
MTDHTEYFESEDFKEILRQYEESVKSGERIYMDADDLADVADYYHYHNRIDEANAAISLAMEYNPEAVGPMLYKAREALEAKDFETADKYADRITPLDTLEAVYLRAEILIKKNDIDKADTILSEYFKNDVPTDEYTDFVKGVVQLYLDYDQFMKAFEWIARFTGAESEGLKELMARTLFGLGKYKDSERLFNELLDKNPYSTNYWNSLAGVQYMKRDYNAALTCSEYAIAIDPNDADGLLSKANTLYTLGNYDEALVYFQRYSEKMPNDEFSYLHQALCLVNKGKNEEGLELLKKAVSVTPVESIYLPEIYQEMAFIYSKIGDVEKALQCIDLTDKLDCDHLHMAVMRGHVLLSNKKEKEARQEFIKALELSHNDPKIKLKIIISYHDNMYLNEAYKLYLGFFKNVDENWKEGYSYIALCCNDLKKEDEFLCYLKKACECNPDEVKAVLGEFFPEDLDPKDYYNYALKHLNNH